MYKRQLLAYSTVSQLGLIMSLLGLGSAALWPEAGNLSGLFALAFFAAVFHLFNHATFKGCLFMVVGIIDLETGTRDIRKLGGLMSVSYTHLDVYKRQAYVVFPEISSLNINHKSFNKNQGTQWDGLEAPLCPYICYVI